MFRMVHDDQALIAEALTCLDTALRNGRLDPDRHELQVVELPSGGRLIVGWNGSCAVAALRRPEPDTPLVDDPTEGGAVVAAFQSAQSGRRNLAALMIQLLALQMGGA